MLCVRTAPIQEEKLHERGLWSNIADQHIYIASVVSYEVSGSQWDASGHVHESDKHRAGRPDMPKNAEIADAAILQRSRWHAASCNGGHINASQ
jgi:hypothetical protein